MTDLFAAAKALVAPRMGILAADESVASATKRLASYNIASSEEMRRQFRDLFLSAPGVEKYLSGVILFEETFGQEGNDGRPFPAALDARGRGAVFTKWRAVIRIEGDQLPTAAAILENAKRLATYAKEAQEAGLVPIVEPEVLLAGKHSRARSKAVIEEVLRTLFSVLEGHSVDLGGLLLKTAMARSGDECARKDMPEEVAQATLEALEASVPREVAGIVFLSGGESPEEATENLAAITREARRVSAPWPLTYSYARALQDEALTVWQGKEENVEAAREAFLTRLARVSAALAS